MSTRDLFHEFEKQRSKHQYNHPHNKRSNPGIEPDGVHLGNMGVDVEVDRPPLIRLTTPQQSLWDSEQSPEWTVIVDNVRGRFDQIEMDGSVISRNHYSDFTVKELAAVHQSQLRPGLGDKAEIGAIS